MGTTKWVVFSSFLWHLLVPLLFFNSPSITCKLGHHGVWIISPTFLQVDKETLLQHYLKKLKYSTVYSTSRPTSWSQHLMNFLDPCIFYSPVNSSYMGRLSMCATMLVCCLWMYSLRVHIPENSRYSSTGGHSHQLPPEHRAVFPSIRLATLWRKPSINANIDPVTTHLSFPYINNIWNTNLYITPCYFTAAPALVSFLP